jgi:hypothetical protein
VTPAQTPIEETGIHTSETHRLFWLVWALLTVAAVAAAWTVFTAMG